MEFNPFDYEFHRDPYPTYEWLREQAPVYHNERMNFWALSRFDDVFAALHDHTTFPSSGGVAIEDTDSSLMSMIDMDPPQHTKLRKVLARQFTPRQIAELEPLVRRWTKTLLDGLEGRSTFDAVHEFTALLPTTIIATMLGIPSEHHDDARRWTDDILTHEDGNPDQTAASAEGAKQLMGLAMDLVTARRREPADDLVTMLVQSELDGQPLSDELVMGYIVLLITGGHETTSKLIANGVRLFARHPDQRAALAADPALLPGAVEEMLRYTSPTQYMARTTSQQVEIRGTVIPKGAKVALLLASGNRDAEEFERPAKFDIFRKNPRILAFGHGPHVCLGAAVARLEGRIATQEFLARFPTYEVDEVGVDFLHSGNVQGPTSVPVTVTR